jgi:hypothetical protein
VVAASFAADSQRLLSDAAAAVFATREITESLEALYKACEHLVVLGRAADVYARLKETTKENAKDVFAALHWYCTLGHNMQKEYANIILAYATSLTTPASGCSTKLGPTTVALRYCLPFSFIANDTLL